MHFALQDVSDNFTRKTGTKLAITFGGAGAIKTKFENGEPADIVILPKPDISSLAGVKETLLAAKTIAYYSAAAGGADGILAEHDFTRLGIAHEVAAKAKLWTSVQEAIVEKSADLIVGWQPPLLSKAADYEFIGTLPSELQDPENSTWTAGASAKSADPARAKAFTQMLASPESLGVFKDKGFTLP
jgi:molybdate transport system substrate-binding protein